MNEPFLQAKLKIERAKRHIAELEHDIADLRARDPFHYRIQLDDSGENTLVVFEARDYVPPYFSAIIGDVVHNLRASLDLVMYELVIPNSSNHPKFKIKKVQFPFRAEVPNEAEFAEMLENYHADLAGERAVRILRSLDLYGDAPLRLVHTLDIRDKHQELIPALMVAPLPNMVSLRTQTVVAHSAFVNPRPGQVVWALANPCSLQANTTRRVQFSVGLEAGGKTRPAAQLLSELATAVASVVHEFDKLARGEPETSDPD